MLTRIVRIATMLLLFVVLPITSWYYLKTGAQWRRDNLNDLEMIGKIPAVNYADGSGKVHNLLERRVCVSYMTADTVLTPQNEKALQICAEIYDQFHARPELRIVVVTPPEAKAIHAAVSAKEGGTTEFWVQTNEQEAWKSVLNPAMLTYTEKRKWQPFQQFVTLNDIDGNVRGVYNTADTNSLKKLAQQLAILLPLK
jgi:hypothetical protein